MDGRLEPEVLLLQAPVGDDHDGVLVDVTGQARSHGFGLEFRHETPHDVLDDVFDLELGSDLEGDLEDLLQVLVLPVERHLMKFIDKSAAHWREYTPRASCQE